MPNMNISTWMAKRNFKASIFNTASTFSIPHFKWWQIHIPIARLKISLIALPHTHHISIKKSCWFYLQNKPRIHTLLTIFLATALVQATTTSLLNYCYVLLISIPASILQFATEPIYTYFQQKLDHVTSLFIFLQWLPISCRGKTKVLT